MLKMMVQTKRKTTKQNKIISRAARLNSYLFTLYHNHFLPEKYELHTINEDKSNKIKSKETT